MHHLWMNGENALGVVFLVQYVSCNATISFFLSSFLSFFLSIYLLCVAVSRVHKSYNVVGVTAAVRFYYAQCCSIPGARKTPCRDRNNCPLHRWDTESYLLTLSLLIFTLFSSSNRRRCIFYEFDDWKKIKILQRIDWIFFSKGWVKTFRNWPLVLYSNLLDQFLS